jgi:hypothetical protein
MPPNDLPEEGPVYLSDIREDIQDFEALANQFSSEDEYLAALNQNVVALLRQQANRGAHDGSIVDDTVTTGGRFSVPEHSALPEDAIGTVARDINPGDTAPAVFQLGGSVFYAVVQNDDSEEMQAGTSVRVIGTSNRVTARGAAGSVAGGAPGSGSDTFRYNGSLYQVPRILTTDEDVKVANQTFVGGTYTDVSDTLDAGQQKEMARIEPSPDEFLLLKYTNATAHDTVEYNYYIDGDFEVDEDLSGQSPWATPPSLHEVAPGGFKLVEDYVAVELAETSGSNSYTGVQATLTGLTIQA